MSNIEYQKWELGRTPRGYTGLPVEAVRLDDTHAEGSNVDDIVTWIKNKGFEASNRDGAVSIGHTTVDPGEWIVLTAANQLRTLDDGLFHDLYDDTPPPLAGG